MNKMNKIINFAYFIMKDFSLMQLIIGLASLFIFLYRTVVLMIPMFMEAYKEKHYGDMLKSLTLLV
tara:strand:- start:892 stop:1089 length:198 start_codon:yes stop_codon:yes gene_type:complete